MPESGCEAIGAVENSAVGYHRDPRARVGRRDTPEHQLDARGEGAQRLAPLGEREIRVARSPALEMLGVVPEQFVVGPAFERTVEALPQCRLPSHCQPLRLRDGRGSLQRPRQIARVNRRQRQFPQPQPGSPRLLVALVIKTDVGVPLETARAVPRRHAVAHQHQFGDRRRPACGAQASLGLSV